MRNGLPFASSARVQDHPEGHGVEAHRAVHTPPPPTPTQSPVAQSAAAPQLAPKPPPDPGMHTATAPPWPSGTG